MERSAKLQEKVATHYLKFLTFSGLVLFLIGALSFAARGADHFLISLFIIIALSIANNLGTYLDIDKKIYFSFSEPIIIFSAVILDPMEQIFPVFLGSAIAEVIFIKKHKKIYPFHRLFFNPSNITISNLIASYAYHSLSSLLEIPNTLELLICIFLAIVVFEFLNSLITSIAVAFDEEFKIFDLAFSVTSLSIFLPTIANLFVSSLLIWSYLNNYILVSSLSLFSLLLVAFIYQQEGKFLQTKKEVISALVETIGARDEYTKKHSLRVSELAVLVAKEMKLPYRVVRNVEFAALLHDLGKINFPDKAFTQKHIEPETWERITKHPEISKHIIVNLSNFEEIALLAELHHERFDGSGYPRKLHNQEIPIEARILAVVDSFDAMTSHRTYRRAFPVEFALKEIEDYKGVAYDPEVVDSFMVVINKVLKELEEKEKEKEYTYQHRLRQHA